MTTLLRDVTQSELFSIEDLSFVKMISSLSTNLEEILTRTDASFLLHCKYLQISIITSLRQTGQTPEILQSGSVQVSLPCLENNQCTSKKKGALGTAPDLTSSCISVQQNDGNQNSPKNLEPMRDLNKIMKPEFRKLLV